MAMTPAGMAAVIEPEIKTQLAISFPTQDQTTLDNYAAKMALAIATGVVNYIKSNAVVTVTGVTPGGGSAAGTIT